jgi:hypothetical protein
MMLLPVPGYYLLRMRSRAKAATAALAFLTSCAVVLLAIYFFRTAWYVFFPADFLVWPEGDFVNDILKFSVGYPLYSPQVNNDSFVYVPGSQLLTYVLARLAGQAGSIPFYRVIQVAYTLAAAGLALLCCRRILEAHGGSAPRSWLWHSFAYALLLLIATNSITNAFVHNLHGDALAQLVTLAGYYLLLRYVGTRSWTVLALMAWVAPVGFLVKQSLVIWAGYFGGFLCIWGRPWRRVMVFAALTGALGAVTLGLCYALWGPHFVYWTWFVLSKHAVSPLRSFQHLMDAWVYFMAGLLGGTMILRGRYLSSLSGVWLVSLGVLAIETYTSGIAWMLNHMGPGCLLAGIWFVAGLTRWWESVHANWVERAAVTASLALLFNGMGLVRIPLRTVSGDAYRYVHDIERQFEGLDAGQVLLDAGSWVYWKQRVVMGDRAPSIGERGYSQTGDFSGILSRIASKRYAKILVRGFHDQDFVYDYYLWSKSSGIRQSLLDNYRETGTIPAAQGPPAVPNWAEDPYYFGEITILEPKPAGL